MATMKQIAQMAGVSRGTVDRVLHGRGVVNEQTAQKVREIAASLNYTPSKAARALAAIKRNIRFTYILFNPNANPFFKQVEAGIQKKAKELKEYDVTVDILHSDFKDETSQCKLIDKALLSGTNGIVIAGHSTQKIAAKIKAARESGVPVITVNTDIENSNRTAYVGSNYYKSGETAGGLMNLFTKGKAKVGVILGSKDILCHTQRVAGFKQYLRAHAPNVEIVEVAENSDDDFESYAIVKKMFKNNPNIDALFLASSGVLGACRMVESLKLKNKPTIICFDCTGDIKEMLEKGVIAATICQEPEYQGAKPLDILFNLTAMGAPPKKDCYYTKIDIVIKANL